jgi:hypothetical protein
MNQHWPHNEKMPAGDLPRTVTPDETLIADARACLTPIQMVERKLVSLSKSNPLSLGFLCPARVRFPQQQ